MNNLICGSSPAESLVVHQLGYTGLLSTHSTAGLFWPQLNGPEFGILSVKHHQLLPTGSCHSRSRKRFTLGKSIMALHDSGARLTIHSEFGHTRSSMSGDSMGITMQEWRTLDNTVYSHGQLYKSSQMSGKWEVSRSQTKKSISTCCAFS